MMGRGETTFFSTRWQSWLDKRLPPRRDVEFDRSNLFIFPTRAGFAFLVLIAMLWLVATNYENNLVFAFVCLLSSLFLLAIFHTYANLSGLTVHWVRAEPVFAKQSLVVELQIMQGKVRTRQAILAGFSKAETVAVNPENKERSAFRLAVPTHRRGWLRPGRLHIESCYPLGLLRVWSIPDLDIRGLVYPRPIFSEAGRRAHHTAGTGQPLSGEGNEDFAGLQQYRPGESMQRISWKHYARERGILSKHYVDLGEQPFWVDWHDYPGMDRETRLGYMCGQLLNLHKQPLEFGMRLPGIEFSPARGEAHLASLLRALALFELDEAQ